MTSDHEEQSNPEVAEEKQLCANCMFPNYPEAHFCAKCGAPLSSYASTGPFESLFAEGHVYRQATEQPRKGRGFWDLAHLRYARLGIHCPHGCVGCGFGFSNSGDWRVVCCSC